jgi:Skp family chaperone for outer membrane proteins
MIIKVVNFEILSKNYVPYQDGITKISDVKKDFITKLEPFKKELESIINRSQGGEKLDDATQARFNELQEYAMGVDEEFKVTMRKMNDELSKTIYGELAEFIAEWSQKNEIDMVIGSTEVVFLKDEHDVTDQVLEIIREKGLHV